MLLTEPDRPLELPTHLKQRTALEEVTLAAETGVFGDIGERRDQPQLESLWHVVDQDADLGSA